LYDSRIVIFSTSLGPKYAKRPPRSGYVQVAFSEIAPKCQLPAPMLVSAADFEVSQIPVSGELACQVTRHMFAETANAWG
jgi:hypothetical protein